MIEALYQTERGVIQRGTLPCPFRLELIAALERTLCYCHTGGAVALATTLMNPLGLSRAVIKDGFPMLLKTFTQTNLVSAMQNGFQVDVRNWPLKNGYPAVASKRTQTLTYSLNHFMVRIYLVLPFHPAHTRHEYARAPLLSFSHRAYST